jgi:hypothetical protein
MCPSCAARRARFRSPLVPPRLPKPCTEFRKTRRYWAAAVSIGTTISPPLPGRRTPDPEILDGKKNPFCERRSNSLAGGHGAGVIPYLHAALMSPRLYHLILTVPAPLSNVSYRHSTPATASQWWDRPIPSYCLHR